MLTSVQVLNLINRPGIIPVLGRFFLILCISCNNNKLVPETVPNPVLNVIPSVTDILFSANGATATSGGSFINTNFWVETNQPSWELTADQAWVSASKVSNRQFIVSVVPVTGVIAPEPAELIIKAGNAASVRIGVQQLAADSAFTVTPEYRDICFMRDGLTGWVSAIESGEIIGKTFTPVFSVATSMSEWDAVSDKPWLTVNKNENTFTLTAVAQTGGIEQFEEARVTVTAGTMPPVTIVANRKGPNYMLAGSPDAGGIVDLALINDGDTRTDWTPDAFKPYLTWMNPATQQEEWLFDGFLFSEGACRDFNFSSGGSNPATKTDMLKYLDQMQFVKGKSLDALDKAVGATIQRLGAPPRPRRVVIMVPDPPPPEVTPNQRPWGELNGKPLDFKYPEDRIAAVKWYVDQLMERWETAAFQNIELAGLYWLRENIFFWSYDYDLDKQFVQTCLQYMKSKANRAFWIPYWEAKGSNEWKQIGFDVAYQQPNHQFDAKVPDSRVAEACNYAEMHGMGMELEWQKEIFLDPDIFIPRLMVNIEGFEKYGVWHEAAVAHYMGGTVPGTNLPYAFMMLSQSTDPRHVALYHRLCSILSDRQKRFAIKP